jgi:tRNA dimethylallyltransferase
MAENPFHQAIYLTGPTASGKSAVGLALARRQSAEILAMDSMTLYRGMDIGTAKPSAGDRRAVRHHLIDVIDPWENSSVALYRQWAGEALIDVIGRGTTPIFVGGTPLFLKALLRGLFEGPAANPEVRNRLEKDADAEGDVALHARLANLDPATAGRLHPNDRRRIIRAIEVFELSGRPISVLQAEHDRPAPQSVRVFALDPPRSVLHDRINRRVERFFDEGLVEEVERLLSAERPPSATAADGIGYREVIEMIRGGTTEAESIARIQARTRQFAKRQATWFRGLEEVRSIPIAGAESAGSIADRIAALLEPG